MLDMNKQIYKKVADLIPGWEKLSKGDLVDNYIKYEAKDPNIANSYMAAIIYSYWPSINKYYQQCKNSFQVEDYHDWLTHAIMYALNHRAWLDSTKAIAKKKNASDIIIKQCILSTRHQNYQKSNYAKYSGGFKTVSLDTLQAVITNTATNQIDDLTYNSKDDSFNNWIKEKVKNLICNKKLLQAIILDNICNGDCFKKVAGVKIKAEYPDNVNTKYKPKFHYGPSREAFSRKKLFESVIHIDHTYSKFFSDTYGISSDIIDLAIEKINSKDIDTFKKIFAKAYTNLKQYLYNEDFLVEKQVEAGR